MKGHNAFLMTKCYSILYTSPQNNRRHPAHVRKGNKAEQNWGKALVVGGEEEGPWAGDQVVGLFLLGLCGAGDLTIRDCPQGGWHTNAGCGGLPLPTCALPTLTILARSLQLLALSPCGIFERPRWLNPCLGRENFAIEHMLFSFLNKIVVLVTKSDGTLLTCLSKSIWYASECCILKLVVLYWP